MIEIALAADFEDAPVPTTLGVIACAVRAAADDDALTRALAKAEARRKAELAHTAIPDVPEIAGARAVYRAFGKDPARYRPSSEALLRRIHQGKGIYRINTVVDAGNLVSIHTGFCIGAYRADRIRPPVTCRRAAAGETYAAIGRYDMNLENLPVLADSEGPFGSSTSDSERTMIVDDATRLLFVIYGFGDTGTGVAAAMDFAIDCLATHCAAADVETGVASCSPKRIPSP